MLKFHTGTGCADWPTNKRYSWKFNTNESLCDIRPHDLIGKTAGYDSHNYEFYWTECSRCPQQWHIWIACHQETRSLAWHSDAGTSQGDCYRLQYKSRTMQASSKLSQRTLRRGTHPSRTTPVNRDCEEHEVYRSILKNIVMFFNIIILLLLLLPRINWFIVTLNIKNVTGVINVGTLKMRDMKMRETQKYGTPRVAYVLSLIHISEPTRPY